MKKSELAHEMRELFKSHPDMDVMDKIKLDELTDDEIVESPVTCSCCGEVNMDKEKIEEIIKKSKSAVDYHTRLELAMAFGKEMSDN